MTSVKGTYKDCGQAGKYSLILECTGPGCSGFVTFPNMQCVDSDDCMHCTNNVLCDQSNLTSSFAINVFDSQAILRENLDIGRSSFLLIDHGLGNVSVIEETHDDKTVMERVNVDHRSLRETKENSRNVFTKRQKSEGRRQVHGISKVMLTVIVLMSMFTSVAYAQPAPTQVSRDIQAAVPPQLQSLVLGLEQHLCEVDGGLIIEAAAAATTPLFHRYLIQLIGICMSALADIEIATGLAEAAFVVPEVGVPILVLGNFILCEEVVLRAILPGPEADVEMICSQLLHPSSVSSVSSVSSASSISTTPQPTCGNPNAAQICKTQGCCDIDCDNLPNGFIQSGTGGVTCPIVPARRCCLGTNGCSYYCNTPPTNTAPASVDCACVGRVCENAITSVSTLTDCGAACYNPLPDLKCVENVLKMCRYTRIHNAHFLHQRKCVRNV